MMKIIVTMFMFSLVILVLPHRGWSWDDRTTHQELSENAVKYSILKSNESVLGEFGLDDGLNSWLTLDAKSKKVIDWFRFGALMEDESYKFLGIIPIKPVGRFYNHFHNPLKSWDDAGLDSIVSGKSALLWAQDDGKNEWAWQKVREYYRLALISASETERSANFAKTFMGLGQIVHLVQDMAQPAHVRNDAHPEDNEGIKPGFEWWAKQPENESSMNTYMSQPIPPNVPLNVTKNGKLPISQFWDTDQYTETSGPLVGTTIGLAEYTNANFFSEDTIFSRKFPYPSKEQTNAKQIEVLAEDGQTDLPWYVTRGDTNEPIAVYSYLEKPLNEMCNTDVCDPDEVKGEWRYMLDDKVYGAYAQKLIPRAVGYSAALIDYFFRGKLKMEADPANLGQYVIKNESDEDMTGTFRLYYDDKDGNRKPVSEDAEWALSIPANSTSTPVTFPASTDAKEAGKYMLVFQGSLGAEEGAVVGKIVTPEERLPFILKVKCYEMPGAPVVYWDADADSLYRIFDKDTGEEIHQPTSEAEAINRSADVYIRKPFYQLATLPEGDVPSSHKLVFGDDSWLDNRFGRYYYSIKYDSLDCAIRVSLGKLGYYPESNTYYSRPVCTGADSFPVKIVDPITSKYHECSVPFCSLSEEEATLSLDWDGTINGYGFNRVKQSCGANNSCLNQPGFFDRELNKSFYYSYKNKFHFNESFRSDRFYLNLDVDPSVYPCDEVFRNGCLEENSDAWKYCRGIAWWEGYGGNEYDSEKKYEYDLSLGKRKIVLPNLPSDPKFIWIEKGASIIDTLNRIEKSAYDASELWEVTGVSKWRVKSLLDKEAIWNESSFDYSYYKSSNYKTYNYSISGSIPMIWGRNDSKFKTKMGRAVLFENITIVDGKIFAYENSIYNSYYLYKDNIPNDIKIENGLKNTYIQNLYIQNNRPSLDNSKLESGYDYRWSEFKKIDFETIVSKLRTIGGWNENLKSNIAIYFLSR